MTLIKAVQAARVRRAQRRQHREDREDEQVDEFLSAMRHTPPTKRRVARHRDETDE